MKNASSMSKDSSNISKSCFSCYFCCSLVNFKNLIILFWNIWVIYGSWKSWRGVMFDLEHIKKDLYFVIPNWLIWSLLRGGWRRVTLCLIFMRSIYINCNLNQFTKFTSSSRITKFKDILPRTSLKWLQRLSQATQE